MSTTKLIEDFLKFYDGYHAEEEPAELFIRNPMRKKGEACWVCHSRRRRCVPTSELDSCEYCLKNNVPCVSQQIMATTYLTYCPIHKKAICRRKKCEYSSRMNTDLNAIEM